MKIKARVLDFGLYIGITAGIGLAYAKAFGLSDEDKEAMLREKYPDIVRETQANRKPMADFFANMKKDIDTRNQVRHTNGTRGGQDGDSETEQLSANQRKFEELLRGGKSNKNKIQGSNAGLHESGTLEVVEKPETIKIMGRKTKEKAAKEKAIKDERSKGWFGS